MSECSMSLRSKKSIVRESRIRNAQKQLRSLLDEEQKLVEQIRQISLPARENFEKLSASKSGPTFKQNYGLCLVSIEDAHSRIQEIKSMLESDSSSELDDSCEDAHFSDKEYLQDVKVENTSEMQPKVDPTSSLPDEIAQPIATPPTISRTEPPTISQTEPTTISRTEPPTNSQSEPPSDSPTEPIISDRKNSQMQSAITKKSAMKETSLASFFDRLKILYKSQTVKVGEYINAVCGYHLGPNYVWLQTSPTVVDRICENICLGLSVKDFQPLKGVPKIGDVVLACYEMDALYYRAVVKSHSPELDQTEVFFIDYGNTEMCLTKSLFAISDELSVVPPQALICSLENLSPADGSPHYSHQAMTLFDEMISLPLKVKLRLCDDDCPLLLVSITSEKQDISKLLLHRRLASPVTDAEIKNKYFGLDKNQSDLYNSCLPAIRSKSSMTVPSRLATSISSSHSAKSSLPPESNPPEPDPPTKSCIYTWSTQLSEKNSETHVKNPTDLPDSRSRMLRTTAVTTNQTTLSDDKSSRHNDYELDHKLVKDAHDIHEKKKTLIVPPNTKESDECRERITDGREFGGKELTPNCKVSPGVAALDNLCQDISNHRTRPPTAADFTCQTPADAIDPGDCQADVSMQQSLRNKSALDQDTMHMLKSVADKLSANGLMCETSLAPLAALPAAAVGSTTSIPALDRPSSRDTDKPHHRIIKSTLASNNRLDKQRQVHNKERNSNNHQSDSTSTGTVLVVPLHSQVTSCQVTNSTPECQVTSTKPEDRNEMCVKGGSNGAEPKSREHDLTNSRLTCGDFSNTPSDILSIHSLTHDQTMVKYSDVCHPFNAEADMFSPVMDNEAIGLLEPNTVATHDSSSQSGEDPPNPSHGDEHEQLVVESNECGVEETAVKLNTPSNSRLEPTKEIDRQSDASGKSIKAEKDLSDSSLHSSQIFTGENSSVTLEPDQDIENQSVVSAVEVNASSSGCMMSPPKCEDTAKLPPQKLEISSTDKSYRVIISHVNTPTDFYINICNADYIECFDQIDGVSEYYNRIYNSMLSTMMKDYLPKLGDHCVARSEQYDAFYRAEVINFRESKDFVVDNVVVRKKNMKTVHVFFVDFGSEEWVNSDSVFPLMPQFGTVAPLAWPCRLIDVYPVEDKKAEFPGGWDKKAVDKVKELLPEGTVCDMLIANPRTVMINETLHVILKPLSENGDDDRKYVNEEIVDAGFAFSDLKSRPSEPLEAGEDKTPTSTNEYMAIAPTDTTANEKESTPASERALTNQSLSHDLDGEQVQASESTGNEMQQAGENDTSKNDEKELANWKPMSDDYYSPSNMYDLNPDDAEVILTGYKSQQPDLRPCKEYFAKGHCHRGVNCPYDHARQRADATTEDRVAVISTDLPMKLPAEGSLVVVEITTIISPARFYVKFPYGSRNIADIINDGVSDSVSSMSGIASLDERDFIQFQTDLSEYYHKRPYIRSDAVAFGLGEIVAAMFSEDENFYRARVVDSDFDNYRVKVFFVDFGNVEWTSNDNIRAMLPRFLHLPFQAVECFQELSPKGDAISWNNEATQYFRDLTEGKLLVCRPKSCNMVSNNMLVELIDVESESDIWINQVMIDAGLAEKSLPISGSSSQTRPNIKHYLPPHYLPG